VACGGVSVFRTLSEIVKRWIFAPAIIHFRTMTNAITDCLSDNRDLPDYARSCRELKGKNCQRTPLFFWPGEPGKAKLPAKRASTGR
jgi:hypothetical protein